MTNDDSANTYRLPYTSAPRRYRLNLAPDLEAASFVGEEVLELEVLERTDRLVMNANELEIDQAVLSPGWEGEEGQVELAVELDPAREQVSFVAGSPIEPGRYRLSCKFRGTLNDRLCGFYRSTFTDEDGELKVIATTQFEQTDARLCFPCYDEPDRKAVFSVTIDAPAGMLAVSNGAEIASSPLASGGRRVSFADTIAMSTYLVAFVVGPLEATEPVDADGVAVRVVHLPGKGHLTAPAIDCACHALRFYADYTGIAYPGDKLDLVGLPDFAAGAMENLGCVTFRESVLLADPNDTARTEMQRVAEVVEHEIAHMWFGDLVTMGWWNGIWLNEAFATFLSLLCQDDYRPEWHCFVGFSREKSAALAIDGLHSTRPIEFPVESPEEASAMFDVLTYEKGTGVLWMIQQYIGPDRFRAGLRDYLRAHQYANTETTDLWDALEQAADDEPVRAIMDSWIYQGGYPLISATGSKGTLELSQEPFSYLAEASIAELGSAIGRDWLVPVLSGPPGRGEARRSLLSPGPVTLELDGALVVNKSGTGFYRVAYDEELLGALRSSFSALEPLERLALLSDTWAVALAGRSDPSGFIGLLSELVEETDPYVWMLVMGALSTLEHVASNGESDLVASFTRELLRPELARVGWERRDGEDEQAPTLRAALVSALGTFGEDDEVLGRSRELFEADRRHERSLDADLAGAVAGVVASHARDEEFEAILERYLHPDSPLDQARQQGALGQVRERAFAERLFALMWSEIRSQNGPYLLFSMLRSCAIGPATWEFITTNYDRLVERFPATSIHRMLEGVTGLSELDANNESLYLDEVREFCISRTEGGRTRLVGQSVERLEVNVRLAQRLSGRYAALLGP